MLALAAAMVGTLFVTLWQPPTAAAVVEIRSGRAVVGRYPLHDPRTIDVAGRLGTSTLVIADNAARFRASPCRNQVCVRQGWQRHDGDTAACLPNRVSLSLAGTARARFDAVSY